MRSRNETSHIIGRRMMSRKKKNQVKVLHSLTPGIDTNHWLVCCTAPTCFPLCSMCFPCCNEPEYITVKRQASKYVFIRENSIEWNEPKIVMKSGPCFGIDPCIYEIQDNVRVLYYDDPIFNRITDQTRCLNECRTCLCGGKGERIQIDAPCCFNLCQRSHTFPCPFVPVCLPTLLFPCALKHEIYVDDAQRGMYEIKAAREAAIKNPLYNDDALNFNTETNNNNNNNKGHDYNTNNNNNGGSNSHSNSNRNGPIDSDEIKYEKQVNIDEIELQVQENKENNNSSNKLPR